VGDCCMASIGESGASVAFSEDSGLVVVAYTVRLTLSKRDEDTFSISRAFSRPSETP
jgi:hypothetical protein